MSKGLEQWKNSLKPEQIAEGMNAAISNAQRLLEDAHILFQSGKYPTATSLAILSIEESGKISILRQLALARDGKDVKEAWKAYRSHTKKNVLWSFPSLVHSDGRHLEDFRPLFGKESDHTAELDNLKQVGFYTDCLGRAHWSQPSEVVDLNTAEWILEVAEILCKNKVYTKKEVELWVEYLKPVWKGPMPAMKQALNAWFNAMVSEGLIDEGKLPFARFIEGDEV